MEMGGLNINETANNKPNFHNTVKNVLNPLYTYTKSCHCFFDFVLLFHLKKCGTLNEFGAISWHPQNLGWTGLKFYYIIYYLFLKCLELVPKYSRLKCLGDVKNQEKIQLTRRFRGVSSL